MNLNEEKVSMQLINKEAQSLICTPLIGRSKEIILNELEEILLKKPDILEWRADYFDSLEDTEEVVALVSKIKLTTGNIPMIFTIRSNREGGQPILLSERETIELSAAICKRTSIEYVDCELSNRPEDIQYLCRISHENNTKLIASFHNFEYTPDSDQLFGKFIEAEAYGMDVAKIAVMPKQLEDVLRLLDVTLEAKRKIKIPVITMSMGELGAVTRMIGGIFGSSLTFGVGQSTSAPGQVPIEDLRQVINIVQKYASSE